MITRNAAIAGTGQAENGGQAKNCHHAEYGNGPEYPTRAHSHGPRDVKPGYQAAPSVPPGRTSVALCGWRLN